MNIWIMLSYRSDLKSDGNHNQNLYINFDAQISLADLKMIETKVNNIDESAFLKHFYRSWTFCIK